MLVNISVVAFPTNVSVAFGSVTVRSAVGSPAERVVSYASAVVPSKTIFSAKAISRPDACPVKVGLLIVGLVNVLFVRVSVPARDAKSASVTAVLNCARVPDTVFEPRAIVLFVRVCAVAVSNVPFR